jgi:hypothetical protein
LRGVVASLQNGLRVTGDSAWFDAQSQAVRDTLIAGVVQNFETIWRSWWHAHLGNSGTSWFGRS